MEGRTLGSQGLAVSAQGLGCMSMPEFYGPSDQDEALATIARAVELGVTFLDTADMYGLGENERVVGRAVRGLRDQVVLASKFGNVRGADGSFPGVRGHAAVRPPSLRRVPPAAGNRPDRPVLPAPR